jgi:hypothetical protein
MEKRLLIAQQTPKEKPWRMHFTGRKDEYSHVGMGVWVDETPVLS